MRLIDADKLLESHNERHRPLNGEDDSKARHAYMQWLQDYYAIENAPTVEAQPVRHGKWKKTTCFQEENMYECSECRWYMYGENVVKAAAYCPNCGAKMDGKVE